MIHRVTIGVTDINVSRNFYDFALDPLGYSRLQDDDWLSHYQSETGLVNFSIIEDDVTDGISQSSQSRIIFNAPDKVGVDTFFENALEVGGLEDQVPKVRNDISYNRYSAGVIDPDGYRIAAIHEPQTYEYTTSGGLNE